MDNCVELCREIDEFENGVYDQFQCEVKDLTREKIDATKLNKARLSDWVFHFAEMYRKYKILSTASKIEDLTSQVQKGQEKIIELQGELIRSKDQQLACVRATVKEELASVQSAVQTEIRSSWSEVVAKSSGQGITSAAKIKEAVKSAVAEDDKSKNFMIFSKEEVSNEDVPTTVAGILQDLNVKPRVVECTRVGPFEQGKSRPIKVKLCSYDAVFNVLRNAKLLKNSCSNRATFIGPDRSKEERAEHKKLVGKMKTMMQDEPGKYHFIRRGVIRSVTK